MARGYLKYHLKILVSSSCCRLAQDTTILHSAQAGSYHLPEAVPAQGATGSREYEKTGEQNHCTDNEGKAIFAGYSYVETTNKPLSSHFPGWLIRTLLYLIPHSAVLSDAGEAAEESKNGSLVFGTLLCTPSFQLTQLPLLPPVWAGQASHLLIWSS